MKFLLIAPRFHTNLYYRVVSLQNAGHKVLVLVLYKGKSEYYKDIDLKQIKLSFLSQSILKLYQFIKKNHLKTSFELFVQSPGQELRKEISQFKPDYILLKAFQNMLAVKSLIIARLYGIKTIMLIQTTKNHIKGSQKLFLLNLFFFKGMNVIAYITPILGTKKIFNDINIQNVYYLPFVFPAKDFPINHNFETIRIISVGKFVKRKDQLLLLKAFNSLKEQSLIELDFYGERADSQYYNKIISFVEKNKLSTKVKIYLNIPYRKILEEYRKYQVFVLSSYLEPAAYSLVEAMSNGLSVICSNENGTACYIEENENGFVFEARNEVDLSLKLKNLFSDKEKLIKMKKKSLSLAIERHNLEDFNRKIINICRQA